MPGGGDDVGRIAPLLSVGLNHRKRGPGHAIKVLAGVFVLFHHWGLRTRGVEKKWRGRREGEVEREERER